MTEVKVGQVWRERDKRFVRYVLVVEILRSAMRKDRALCGPCDANGLRTYGGRISKIKVENLQKRFVLVGDKHATTSAEGGDN